MTPDQEALNNRIIELPVIVELREKDGEIIDDLEGLKEGQKKLSEYVHNGFTKGTRRMDGIEDELKSLKDEFQRGIKEVITEIKDQKISDLKKDLSDRKASDSTLKNDLIKIAVVTILGAIGFLFLKAYG